MRAAAARYGTAGSLVLTALVVAPAGSASGAPAPSPEDRGSLVAAERAEAAGIRWGACPAAEDMPPSLRCGTVAVPLDYARPRGRRSG
ncbi:Alpha/beta hydrolase OS=Streptomyces alboniger OX=132473 GN=CP975_28055 PE=3 SV=1 [Streptomyces alboniger]